MTDFVKIFYLLGCRFEETAFGLANLEKQCFGYVAEFRLNTEKFREF